MIQIKLMVNGKEETFRAAGVNLRNSLLSYDLYKEYTEANGDYSKDLLERCLDFICSCFGYAFNVDQLQDGYKGSAFILIPGMLDAVVGYVHEQIVNFPKPAQTPEMMAEAMMETIDG